MRLKLNVKMAAIRNTQYAIRNAGQKYAIRKMLKNTQLLNTLRMAYLTSLRSRCTSMPQKRKCGMRRRFAKQCLHAGFYSLKVLTGYADRVRIMRPGAPGRICMVAPSFSTARTRIQRFAIAVDARSRTARTLRSVCLSTDETLTPF